MSYEIPPGSHRIPLDEARVMVLRYGKNMDMILNPDLVAQNILPISETFRKDAFLAYLAKDFVYAFRIYYGMSEDMQIHAILVGVDKDGKDILPKPINAKGHDDHEGHNGHGHGHPHPPGDPGDDTEDGEIFEDALRCPTYCPPPGWPCLNSNV